jgi:hypothetical protein
MEENMYESGLLPYGEPHCFALIQLETTILHLSSVPNLTHGNFYLNCIDLTGGKWMIRYFSADKLFFSFLIDIECLKINYCLTISALKSYYSFRYLESGCYQGFMEQKALPQLEKILKSKQLFLWNIFSDVDIQLDSQKNKTTGTSKNLSTM